MTGILLIALLAIQPGELRRIVIISDMHLGLGVAHPNDHVICPGPEPEVKTKPPCPPALPHCCWHPMEDFRWTDEFEAFLREQSDAKGGNTDLVLNGDTFELWQSTDNDCIHENKDLGCTEKEALSRVVRVLNEHKHDLQVLRDFAVDHHNRVFIIPGNHDAALTFPHVKEKVLQAINAPGRVFVEDTDGFWRSADGLVFATHGHQVDDINSFYAWPPFRVEGGTTYLDRPWGEQFVQRFYNQQETKFPAIDNIAGEINGIRYGLAAQGLVTNVVNGATFLRFFVFSVSARQFGTTLAVTHAPPPSTQWDTAAIRQKGAAFFFESLPEDDLARPALAAAAERGELDTAFHDLRDEDLQAICDERAALLGAGYRVQRCQARTASALMHKLARDDDKRLMLFLGKTYREIAQKHSGTPQFAVVVLSHTHAAKDRYDPNRLAPDAAWHPTTLNTGAWQRIISAKDVETLRRRKHWSSGMLLHKLQPEHIAPPCYPFVVVEEYSKEPNPRLMYWTQSAGKWQAAAKCATKP